MARRHEKVQRIVQACPEVAAASQLQQLCSAVQAHVGDVEQSCIMVQWMMQEVADLGISGISWNPAKVSFTHACIECVAAGEYADVTGAADLVKARTR